MNGDKVYYCGEEVELVSEAGGIAVVRGSKGVMAVQMRELATAAEAAEEMQAKKTRGRKA